MKYRNVIVIDLPRDHVIKLFDNAENMKYWQEGLINYEHLSGTPGEQGAKMKLNYKMGKREIEMIETITKRELPEVFNGTYEAKGVFNIVGNKFEILDENKTLWTSENEFRFKGFMKIVAFLMPGAFKKQSMKYMKDFKAFAEKTESQS